ncbi:MAG: peptide chain release factor N(5)-glutamine methyltransferase [Candidatus Eutrophobiaceae bacterium]
MQIKALLRSSKSLLPNSGSARLDMEILLAHVLGVERSHLYAHSQTTLGREPSSGLRLLLEKRCAGWPIAYLIGRREFWSLDLRVNESVLIPRAETETLVEMALEAFPAVDQPIDALELGTGSGAVAIALAKERAAWRILATDHCPAALDLARKNAIQHGTRRIRFQQADWFKNLPTGRNALIISNPPYVAATDPVLDGDGLRFEPRNALTDGEDGFSALTHIVRGAQSHLHPSGLLILEHGADQGSPLRELMRTHGYTQVHTQRDLAGHERITAGRLI